MRRRKTLDEYMDSRRQGLRNAAHRSKDALDEMEAIANFRAELVLGELYADLVKDLDDLEHEIKCLRTQNEHALHTTHTFEKTVAARANRSLFFKSLYKTSRLDPLDTEDSVDIRTHSTNILAFIFALQFLQALFLFHVLHS